MMRFKFLALSTSAVRELQSGGADANGQPPEIVESDGNGNPCRHCCKEIPEGDSMLVLAYRPFPDLQPYAETGPIFLCARQCERHDMSSGLPEIYAARGKMLIRGYGKNHRIVYGTGTIVPMEKIEEESLHLLERPEISYLHMRSPSNNCYHGRIEYA